MNLPVGDVVEKRVPFDKAAPDEKVSELLGKGFNGYFVATAQGAAGMEEGLLIIRNREIVGAIFEAMAFGKVSFGIIALKLALNAIRAEKGVFDASVLSKQQIDLIIAFNDKVELRKPVDKAMFSRLLPASYRKEVALGAIKGALPESDPRESVLKRFGLGSI